LDYVVDLMDWEKNIDPHYRKSYFRPPVSAGKESGAAIENWISYANPCLCATELTVMPGETVTVRDPMPYGAIVVQGHGRIGVHQAESATVLRFGQVSADEFFVGEPAAARGVTITNASRCEPLVLLKHFGPGHPDMPTVV
jgi:hypothetical protein